MSLAQQVHGLWVVMPGTSPSVLVSKTLFISVMSDVGVEYRGSLKVFVATLIHSRNLVISFVIKQEISFLCFSICPADYHLLPCVV